MARQKKPVDLRAAAAQLDAEQDALAEAQKLHGLRRANDRLTAQLKQRDAELAEALARLAVLEHIDRLDPEPPRWLQPAKPRPADTMVVAMLSDCHWDEIVHAADVAGVNSFNREIAVKRTRRWAEQVAALPDTGPAANIKGAVVMLGGDLTCGFIDTLHLVSSDDTTLGSLLFWSEQAAAALTLIADAYGRVHVPAVIGNHGRMTAKKRTSGAAADNTDYHLCRLIRRLLADDKRFTWQIDEAPDAEFPVFGQRHVLTHGDSTSGGGGIGGVFPPIMRMVARKQQRQAALGRPFDHLWLGHFHQVIYGPGWTANGSLKGYDGYAASHNFPAERPAQVAAFVDRDGIAWRTAIRL